MGFRLVRPDTAFPLSTEKKRKRQEAPDYLKQIRMLPCLVCGGRPVEAAHIRTGSLVYAKRETGTAEKPDDRWTLPLCAEHHREQHQGNEIAFWASHGIDPFSTACALWGAKGDDEAMFLIIRNARRPK
jgi:hypothetical protein